MKYIGRWLLLDPKVKTCWIIKGFFASLFLPLLFLSAIIIPLIKYGLTLLLFYIVIIIIINIIIIAWVVMFYDRYTYRIGAKTVNIKRGILWKRDVIIPYERIQHVSSTRGPIEQLFGLHIINIFTAGTASVTSGLGGASGMFSAEGYIPGITDPEGLRKTIMNKVKRSKSGSGLGEEADEREEKIGRARPLDSEIVSELKKIRKLLEKDRKLR